MLANKGGRSVKRGDYCSFLGRVGLDRRDAGVMLWTSNINLPYCAHAMEPCTLLHAIKQTHQYPTYSSKPYICDYVLARLIWTAAISLNILCQDNSNYR